MRKTRNAHSRLKAELFVLCILALALVTVLLWRGGRDGETAETTETAETAVAPSALPTQAPTPSPIPPDMFEWREGEYVHVDYGDKTSTLIDGSRLTDPYVKNSTDLVIWVQMAWENQWGYVWGTFGDVLTEDLLSYKLEQYPEGVGDYEQIIREKWMGRRVADCAGLIKSYCWYDPDSGTIPYKNGDLPDCGTEEFYDGAEVKGDISTLPERPGLLLHGNGHVGVYIGGGYAIEAIATAGGVVKTKVADRPWLQWMECPYIRYDS